jgi:formylglycine-generating enzyme required for sulfatase activity
MTRRSLVLLALAACDSSRSTPRVEVIGDVASPADAATDADLDAFVEVGLASRLDRLEPDGAAPRPLLRKHRAGDCSTEYAPRPARDSNPMCRIRGDRFRMGGAFEDPPRHIVSSQFPPVAMTVRDFDIDQFEVTAQQVALFLNAHGNECPGLQAKTDTQRTHCVDFGYANGLQLRDGKFSVVPGHAQVVVENFSFEGAMRYCAWVGKQVASSAQWEYAARHDPQTGQDLVYPWGNAWRANHTCTLRDDCPSEMKRFKGLSVAGMFDGSRGRGDGSSPFGVHDTLEAGGELVFDCDSPDETCRAGTPCGCRFGKTPSGQYDPAITTTYARLVFPFQGAVRCVVPR